MPAPPDHIGGGTGHTGSGLRNSIVPVESRIRMLSFLPRNLLFASHGRPPKPLLPVVAAALALTFSGVEIQTAQAETIHVFLIGGQSNGDGRASSTGLPSQLLSPQTDVPYYWANDTAATPGVPTSLGTLLTLRPNTSRTSQLGPEVTFGRSMSDSYAAYGQKIAIIKYAAGGTNLYSQWAAGGTSGTAGDGSVYKSFQSIVGAGLSALQTANPGKTLSIDGMIWMQGESDSIATFSAQYQTNLTNFISDIRLTYGASLPFVIGQLSANQTGTGSASFRNDVRAA